ncbi:hypothetical protein [Pseudozobellia sp. WGM2]|uniref:hypothetical protein n=1 Tax=Pseudozobellia sp. WGM2 TaxID=2787625 RepID=UPI001ADFFB07|nr:hypothetical protein [Pseudozobellia sp. WGM2]
MEDKNLDKLFDKLRSDFDCEEPSAGHQNRFLEKLNTSQQTVGLSQRTVFWQKPMNIAAAILVIGTLSIFMFPFEKPIEEQVAEISPEVSKTEFYFTSLIEQQIDKLEKENSPETKRLVEDAMLQLEKLEKNYTQLEDDLLNGGNSKLILSAMIKNFQTRIDLLQEVLDKIENIKQLPDYDKNTTI